MEERIKRITIEVNDNLLSKISDCSIRIQKVGMEHCSPRKMVENRRKDYYSLHFVMFGKGMLKFGNDSVRLTKGYAFLIYPGEEFQYEYCPEKSDPWSYIWIDFTGSELDKLLNLCGFSAEQPYVKLEDYNGMASEMMNLQNEYNLNALQSLTCSAHLLNIFSRLIKEEKASNALDQTRTVMFSRVRDILIYINNNYRLKLSPETVAAEMNISTSHLMNIFPKVVGKSMMSYLEEFRIAAACELLKQSDLSAEEVAKDVGIGNGKYFYRLFKKVKGVTPSEYRKFCSSDDPYLWLKEKDIDFR